MSYTQRAIEDAENSGWWSTFWNALLPEQRFIEIALLDPDFWRALGRALDWYAPAKREHAYSPDHSLMPNWLDAMHAFIDHRAAGHDIESFFAEIYQDKK
jgi:hypothetical protein